MSTNLFQSQQQPSNETMRVPIRDAATAQQVNTVLGILGMALSSLSSISRLQLDMEDNDEDDGYKHVITGESRIAAETTFVNACERLDKILQDESRWSMAHQDRIEKDRQDMVKAQMTLQHHQAALAAEMTSPHFRYRPTVARATDGDWIAFIGDPNDLRNAIVGVGQKPQEAIDDFDKKFGEPMPSVVMQWLNDYEQSINQGQQPDPFPTLTTHEVDTRTDAATPQPEEGGTDGQRDSGSDGAGLPAGDN